MSTPFDPNRTAAMPTSQATQAMPAMGDMNRTQAVAIQPSAPPAGPGIEIRLVPSRLATMANGPAREQFLLEIEARGGLPGVNSGVRAPLNLCLVLDRSGSMEGAPLEYAKQACAYVVDLLSPDDILSIVTFEEVVDVLMPPQRVVSKEPIKAGLAQIQAGNTTNLFDGLSLGLQQVAMVNDPGRVTRMVVLTDGDPTAGIKDFGALVNHAGEIRNRGITVTFLGFGPDYNEELLASMAKKAGGNYAYIPRPEMIPEVFRLEVDKLLQTAAIHAKIDLKTSRWVTLRSATGLNAPPTGNTVEIPLADIERGSVMQLVFDFDFQNHPLGWYRVAAGKLVYDDAGTGGQRTIDLDFVMEFTADAAKYSAPTDPRVSRAADVSAAGKAVEKTLMGMKTGQFSTTMAIQELQRTQAILVQQGRTGEAQEVTMALRALQTGDVGTAQKTLMGTVVHLDQGKSS